MKNVALQSTNVEFTIQTIVDYLLVKYPEYGIYTDKAMKYTNPKIIIRDLAEGDYHTKRICEKMELNIIQTMVVRNTVMSLLTEKGLPKSK